MWNNVSRLGVIKPPPPLFIFQNDDLKTICLLNIPFIFENMVTQLRRGDASQIWTWVEDLKSGFAESKMYFAKEICFSKPRPLG